MDIEHDVARSSNLCETILTTAQQRQLTKQQSQTILNSFRFVNPIGGFFQLAKSQLSQIPINKNITLPKEIVNVPALKSKYFDFEIVDGLIQNVSSDNKYAYLPTFNVTQLYQRLAILDRRINSNKHKLNGLMPKEQPFYHLKEYQINEEHITLKLLEVQLTKSQYQCRFVNTWRGLLVSILHIIAECKEGKNCVLLQFFRLLLLPYTNEPFYEGRDSLIWIIENLGGKGLSCLPLLLFSLQNLAIQHLTNNLSEQVTELIANHYLVCATGYFQDTMLANQSSLLNWHNYGMSMMKEKVINPNWSCYGVLTGCRTISTKERKFILERAITEEKAREELYNQYPYIRTYINSVISKKNLTPDDIIELSQVMRTFANNGTYFGSDTMLTIKKAVYPKLRTYQLPAQKPKTLFQNNKILELENPTSNPTQQRWEYITNLLAMPCPELSSTDFQESFLHFLTTSSGGSTPDSDTITSQITSPITLKAITKRIPLFCIEMIQGIYNTIENLVSYTHYLGVVGFRNQIGRRQRAIFASNNQISLIGYVIYHIMDKILGTIPFASGGKQTGTSRDLSNSLYTTCSGEFITCSSDVSGFDASAQHSNVTLFIHSALQLAKTCFQSYFCFKTTYETVIPESGANTNLNINDNSNGLEHTDRLISELTHENIVDVRDKSYIGKSKPDTKIVSGIWKVCSLGLTFFGMLQSKFISKTTGIEVPLPPPTFGSGVPFTGTHHTFTLITSIKGARLRYFIEYCRGKIIDWYNEFRTKVVLLLTETASDSVRTNINSASAEAMKKRYLLPLAQLEAQGDDLRVSYYAHNIDDDVLELNIMMDSLALSENGFELTSEPSSFTSEFLQQRAMFGRYLGYCDRVSLICAEKPMVSRDRAERMSELMGLASDMSNRVINPNALWSYSYIFGIICCLRSSYRVRNEHAKQIEAKLQELGYTCFLDKFDKSNITYLRLISPIWWLWDNTGGRISPISMERSDGTWTSTPDFKFTPGMQSRRVYWDLSMNKETVLKLALIEAEITELHSLDEYYPVSRGNKRIENENFVELYNKYYNFEELLDHETINAYGGYHAYTLARNSKKEILESKRMEDPIIKSDVTFLAPQFSKWLDRGKFLSSAAAVRELEFDGIKIGDSIQYAKFPEERILQSIGTVNSMRDEDSIVTDITLERLDVDVKSVFLKSIEYNDLAHLIPNPIQSESVVPQDALDLFHILNTVSISRSVIPGSSDAKICSKLGVINNLPSNKPQLISMFKYDFSTGRISKPVVQQALRIKANSVSFEKHFQLFCKAVGLSYREVNKLKKMIEDIEQYGGLEYEMSINPRMFFFCQLNIPFLMASVKTQSMFGDDIMLNRSRSYSLIGVIIAGRLMSYPQLINGPYAVVVALPFIFRAWLRTYS
uniref:RNA-dependent RNA polymerase n=1 Tax=Hubei reo-like virus 6 TaxID=1923181 RepID=A0A1L3KP76_9VIRU|nr:RNA-dependent RNA polymerase [Hubei reo-like virus 6]